MTMSQASGTQLGTGAQGTGYGSAAEGPGDSAYAIAQAQLNKPYVYGAVGPSSFDCSGLTWYSYSNGPHIDIGRDTNAQWGSPNLNTICDVFSNALGGSSPIPSSLTQDQLEVGDLLYYFIPGNSGPQAHVRMYAGGGQCIEAPGKGGHVQMVALDLKGTSAEPFRGARRASGGGSLSAGTTGQGTGSGNNPTMTAAQAMAATRKQLEQLPDPRNNLPFSAAFEGQKFSGSTGDFQVPGFGAQQTLYPLTKLVRGGMGEMMADLFKCYFMMNPQTIDVTVGIDNTHTSPFQMSANEIAQSGGFGVTSQTITFTLIFNRMYEVWQGGFPGPNGTPGPSGEGCRWDIRALERLMGVFDASTANGGDLGLGNNGWGPFAAGQVPLQVVFGGKNALRFQGIFSGLDYTFTLFDTNMIPIEATATVSIMRVYNPTIPDINSLFSQTNPVGPQSLSNPSLGTTTTPFTQ